MSCVYTHDFETAEVNLNKALELSPKSSFSQFSRIHLSLMHFIRKDYEKARKVAVQCLAENANFPTALRLLAASEGQLGNLEAAANTYRKFDELAPSVTISNTLDTVMFVHQDDMDRFAEGLRRAGMPE